MTPLHRNVEKNMQRAHLNLIDSSGDILSADIQAACEKAFKRVVLEFLNFDQALIADWAEEVAIAMQEHIETIRFPRQYAYRALKGKVRDWSRTGPGLVELKGIGPDLEDVAGESESFVKQADRKRLLEQVLPSLNARDRVILYLLLNDKSTTAIAAFLNVNYDAAAKAMQRMKDRVSVILEGTRHKVSTAPEPREFRKVRGTGSEP